MIIKTKAIVLKLIKYNEKSNIIYLYTEEYGRVSYFIRNIKSKKSSLKRAYLQPLSLITISVNFRGSKGLQSIRDVAPFYSYKSVIFDPIKNIISFFISDVLINVLKESEKNEILFDFIVSSLKIFDITDKGVANFHIVFFIKLTRFLGVYPNLENESYKYFDMQEGCMTNNRPLHDKIITGKDVKFLLNLEKMTYKNMYLFKFSALQRREIIELIMMYYRLHFANFFTPKSYDILVSFFS